MAEEMPSLEQGVALRTEPGEGNMSSEEVTRSQSDNAALEEVRDELTKKLDSTVDEFTRPEIPPYVGDDDVTEYVEPVPDPYKKAISYLEQHNILQLFQAMTTNIVYKRPENPVDFMISEIEEMKKHREESSSDSKQS